MELRETEQADMDFMAKHSVSRGDKSQPKELDYTYTLFHEDKLLGIGGIKLLNMTTAWCWVNISEEAQGHMVMGYRVIKEWLDGLIKVHKLKRLMAAVQIDFPEAIRMVEHLGFTQECVMKNWKGEKSAFLYALIL